MSGKVAPPGVVDLVRQVVGLVDGGRILNGGLPIEDPAVIVGHDFRVNCAASRAAVGTGDAFWERLLRMYGAGARPCGSLDGHRTLVVFVPGGRVDAGASAELVTAG